MRKSYKTIPCKGCGDPVRTSLKRPYCSAECRIASMPPVVHKTVEITCCICGKKAEKRINITEANRKRCCSRACQTQYALITNAWRPEIDWDRRSKAAKKKYKKQQELKRKHASTDAIWWLHCKLNQQLYGTQDCEWTKRCVTSASGLGRRLDLANAKQLHVKTANSWHVLCETVRITGSAYAVMNEWSKKCYSTCKNMKWKRRLRSVKQNIWKPTKKAELRPRQRTLWESVKAPPQTN